MTRLEVGQPYPYRLPESVRALRLVSFSPAFTRELHRAISEQLSRPFDQREHDRAIQAAYKAWPDTADMLASAIARCEGGQ